MARHNEIGVIGEDIATKYMINAGMFIVERNYLRKWGEIDIVTRETIGKIHFVEVKSVSYETKEELKWVISHGTHRPEDNVHKNKQDRLKRAIQTWIFDNKWEGEFQIDIVVVYLVPREKYARIKYMENIIFD
jgi:putative endonuclease